MSEMTNLRVLANCTVDLVQEVPEKKWEVTVTGIPPYDYMRVYTLATATDDAAAKEGLRLFVEEVQKMHDPNLKSALYAVNAGIDTKYTPNSA